MKPGTYNGRAVLEGKYKIEVAKVKGTIRVRGNIEIVDGEFAGEVVRYSGKLDEKSIRWTKRDLMALGWQGKSVRTLESDLAIGAVAPVEVELADYNGEQWWSVRSIGYVPAPKEEVTDEDLAKADGWFGDVDAQGRPVPIDQPPNDDDIPF